MFVIADARHKIPSFLWKILPDGTALITVDLSKAPQFVSRQEAKDFLAKATNKGHFVFSVHELVIKV